MIDIGSTQINSYRDTPKYRAVLWQYFSPLERAKKERQDFVDDGGLPTDAEFLFPDPPPSSDEELVEIALDYVFSPKRAIAPQRFNDATFPALYTAKEPQTATDELRNGAGAGEEYVVFTVSFTGDAFDLRPAVRDGRLRWPLEYPDCQSAASSMRRTASGLASNSARRSGGSCCTIFYRMNVAAGTLFDRGIL